MSISVTISKSKNEDIKKIRPNFTPNRFDLVYKKNYNVLIAKDGQQSFYIPYHIDFFTCKFGIWLSEIPKNIIMEAITFIFAHYFFVFKIKILSYTQDILEKSDKATDYWIDLPLTEQEYIQGLSSKTRYNLTRHIKKLEEEVGKYSIIKYEKDKIPIKIIKEYFKFKKMTIGKSYILTPQKYLEKYNITSMYVLNINGKTGAIVLISEIGNTAYLENITYNPILSQYSVGITVCVSMIIDLIKQGKNKIYFGSSNKDDYKRRLCNSKQTTYSIKINRWDF